MAANATGLYDHSRGPCDRRGHAYRHAYIPQTGRRCVQRAPGRTDGDTHTYRRHVVVALCTACAGPDRRGRRSTRIHTADTVVVYSVRRPLLQALCNLLQAGNDGAGCGSCLGELGQHRSQQRPERRDLGRGVGEVTAALALVPDLDARYAEHHAHDHAAAGPDVERGAVQCPKIAWVGRLVQHLGRLDVSF